MVDDSPNRADGTKEGEEPIGSAASNGSKRADSQSELILKLLGARLGLPDLRDALRPGEATQIPSRPIATDAIDAAWNLNDSNEMTPAPMVVETTADAAPTAMRAASGARERSEERRVDRHAPVGDGRDASPPRGVVMPRAEEFELAIDSESSPTALNASSEEPRARISSTPPEYHPPRPPPPSLAPPPVATSISIATEYDPKAPTRPKVRRNTSAPPPPLLFGLDRMLVWGLVLGGLFVAVIVVIVHEFAFTPRPRKELAGPRSAESGRAAASFGVPRSTDSAAEQTHAGTAEAASSAARSATSHSDLRNGSNSAGATHGTSTKDSSKSKPAASGSAKVVPQVPTQSTRETNSSRKSWIE